MKRNTIFMWAYITFIIISIVLRLFVNYSLWTPTVIAVSISCVFFAVEDLLTSLYKVNNAYYQILKQLLQKLEDLQSGDVLTISSIKALTAEENSLHLISNEITDSIRQKIGGLREDDRISRSQIESLSKMFLNLQEKPCLENNHDKEETKTTIETEGIAKLQDLIDKKNVQTSRLQKAADIVAFLGFLCLFCFLVLSSYISIPKVFQDELTIIPFAIVLVLRQLNEFFANKEQEILIGAKDVVNAGQKVSVALEEYKKAIEARNRATKELNEALSKMEAYIESSCQAENRIQEERQAEATTDAD